jgi:hypothetical protein
MNLDINTPRGQVTLQDERKAKVLFERAHPEFKYIDTPKDEISAVDGMVEKHGELFGVVETKCRYDLTEKFFRERWNGLWLITHDKLKKGRMVSELLRVPLWGFLFIVDDNTLLTQKMFCPKSKLWIAPFHIERTQTQATVNGGSANRVNAFIDMNKAKVIK